MRPVTSSDSGTNPPPGVSTAPCTTSGWLFVCSGNRRVSPFWRSCAWPSVSASTRPSSASWTLSICGRYPSATRIAWSCLAAAAIHFFPYAEYRGLADRSRSLAGLAASEPEESDLSFEGNGALMGAEPVSGSYAAVLGARTLLGRWFVREDEPAAVISYNAWQRLFHRDPHVLGKTVRSESHTYTVVGVTPPEFGGIYMPLRIDLWVPFRFWAGDNAEHMRVMAFGSLKRGVTLSQAS